MLLKYTSATLKNFAAPLQIILNFLYARFRERGAKRPAQGKERRRRPLGLVSPGAGIEAWGAPTARCCCCRRPAAPSPGAKGGQRPKPGFFLGAALVILALGLFTATPA